MNLNDDQILEYLEDSDLEIDDDDDADPTFVLSSQHENILCDSSDSEADEVEIEHAQLETASQAPTTDQVSAIVTRNTNDDTSIFGKVKWSKKSFT